MWMASGNPHINKFVEYKIMEKSRKSFLCFSIDDFAPNEDNLKCGFGGVVFRHLMATVTVCNINIVMENISDVLAFW